MLRRNLLKALIAAPAIGASAVAAAATVHETPTGRAGGEKLLSGRAHVIRHGSGKYMEITNSDLRVFDADGTCRVRMGMWQ